MKVLDFSVNVNALGPPPDFVDRVRALASNVNYYPDYANRDALAALSEFTRLPIDHLAIGAGATEFIFLTPRAFAGRKSLIIIPTFWEYAISVERSCGSEALSYHLLRPDESFALAYELIEEQVPEGGIVFLCNPNNPTSTLADKREISAFINSHPNTLFVIDETYLLFREDYDDQTMLREVPVSQNIIVITSLSKFFAVPGLRLGFLAGAPELVRFYTLLQVPYTVGSLAQMVVPSLVQNRTYIDQTRRFYRTEIPRFQRLLGSQVSNVLSCFAPQTNFVLAQVVNGLTSTELTRILRDHGIVVRDCAQFMGLDSSWLRFSVRQREENEAFIQIISENLC